MQLKKQKWVFSQSVIFLSIHEIKQNKIYHLIGSVWSIGIGDIVRNIDKPKNICGKIIRMLHFINYIDIFQSKHD